MSDLAIAHLPRRALLQGLAGPACGGALGGAFIGAAPLLLALAFAAAWLPLLAWMTVRKSRRSASARTGVHVGAVIVVVAACAAAPCKPFDRAEVGPFPRPRMTLAGIAEHRGLRFLAVQAGDEARVVDVGTERMSVTELLRRIHAATGLRAAYGTCGNGASILFGASPMGRIRLE